MSVKLLSRIPFGQIRTLALDEGSRTSAALARILLAERYGVAPAFQAFPLECEVLECDADAVLMIGDRAMHSSGVGDFPYVADLGKVWTRWTGLPFVFAVWAARPDIDLHHVPASLNEARDRGLVAVDEIAEREAESVGLSWSAARRYLRRHLHFRIGEAEREGLALFAELAAENGLLACVPELDYEQPEPSAVLV